MGMLMRMRMRIGMMMLNKFVLKRTIDGFILIE